MSESRESLRWQDILEANPDAQKGKFNLERFGLLKPGVYADLSELTAAGWMPTLRQRMTTQGKILSVGGPKKITSGKSPIRITIVEIGDGENNGKILVEADGIQEWILSSVFAHCIEGKATGIMGIASSGNIACGQGWGTAPQGRMGDVG